MKFVLQDFSEAAASEFLIVSPPLNRQVFPKLSKQSLLLETLLASPNSYPLPSDYRNGKNVFSRAQNQNLSV